VSDYLHRAVRYGMRRGFDRGLLEGSGPWTVVGALALLMHLGGRAMHRQPETVFSRRLPAGETFEVVHESHS
jgi:hypothetical protein